MMLYTDIAKMVWNIDFQCTGGTTSLLMLHYQTRKKCTKIQDKADMQL